MPWVKFNADTFRGEEESPMSVYLRGSMRNETFTLSADSISRHDRNELLSLYYESTRVREYEEKQYDKDEHKTAKIQP